MLFSAAMFTRVTESLIASRASSSSYLNAKTIRVNGVTDSLRQIHNDKLRREEDRGEERGEDRGERGEDLGEEKRREEEKKEEKKKEKKEEKRIEKKEFKAKRF